MNKYRIEIDLFSESFNYILAHKYTSSKYQEALINRGISPGVRSSTVIN